MKKTTSGLTKQAEEKAMEEKQNEMIEKAIFGKPSDSVVTSTRFKKQI